VKILFGLWVPASVLIFWPDFLAVQWLSWLEIAVGWMILLLIPLGLVLISWISMWVSRGVPPGFRPFCLASAWVSCDVLLGFCRCPIPLHWGVTLYDWPLGLQIADLVGIWGVTWLTIYSNGLIALLIQEGPRPQLRPLVLGTVVLLVGVGSYSHLRLQQLTTQLPWQSDLRVAALQPVGWLERDRSWSYREQQYQVLKDLSLQGIQAGASLILWPEGALRARLLGTDLEPYLIAPITEKLPAQGGLITGATEPDPEFMAGDTEKPSNFNAALLFNARGHLEAWYGKQWIFPLFEAKRFIPAPSGYQPLQSQSLGPIGVMICLESVLPHPSRSLVRGGAEMLVVIADDSSFGNSHWPRLHAALSVFRAVENRRSLVFVNNTGSNLIVDPTGKIQHLAPVFQPQVLIGDLWRLQKTALFTLVGEGFAWSCLGITALCLGQKWRSSCKGSALHLGRKPVDPPEEP
jgi:apolipoprotein N-acyltransferase